MPWTTTLPSAVDGFVDENAPRDHRHRGHAGQEAARTRRHGRRHGEHGFSNRVVNGSLGKMMDNGTRIFES
ncbi:hypothetical protein JTE90_002208 [Oedothorax gibbosus]|uniref:Wingless n=1 Tax=Oedothorax gibbosus TaxID=931172 RepID=A0AAV6VIR7_9ARAC|nr:hypothetical protein JTE90_002208 [Oedothorax gibbosus]